MAETSETFLKDSGWEYITSEGRTASVGNTYSLSLSTGSIYVAPHLAKDDPYELSYRSVGGSVGWSMGSASLEVATKFMDSSGVIYANPLKLNEATLGLDDLTGAYLAYQVELSAGEGRSWTVMFLSVGLGVVTAFLTNAASVAGGPVGVAAAAALTPASVIASCHSAVWFWSDYIASTPGGSVSISLGYLNALEKE